MERQPTEEQIKTWQADQAEIQRLNGLTLSTSEANDPEIKAALGAVGGFRNFFRKLKNQVFGSGNINNGPHADKDLEGEDLVLARMADGFEAETNTEDFEASFGVEDNESATEISVNDVSATETQELYYYRVNEGDTAKYEVNGLKLELRGLENNKIILATAGTCLGFDPTNIDPDTPVILNSNGELVSEGCAKNLEGKALVEAKNGETLTILEPGLFDGTIRLFAREIVFVDPNSAETKDASLPSFEFDDKGQPRVTTGSNKVVRLMAYLSMAGLLSFSGHNLTSCNGEPTPIVQEDNPQEPEAFTPEDIKAMTEEQAVDYVIENIDELGLSEKITVGSNDKYAIHLGWKRMTEIMNAINDLYGTDLKLTEKHKEYFNELALKNEKVSGFKFAATELRSDCADENEEILYMNGRIKEGSVGKSVNSTSDFDEHSIAVALRGFNDKKVVKVKRPKKKVAVKPVPEVEPKVVKEAVVGKTPPVKEKVEPVATVPTPKHECDTEQLIAPYLVGRNVNYVLQGDGIAVAKAERELFEKEHSEYDQSQGKPETFVDPTAGRVAIDTEECRVISHQLVIEGPDTHEEVTANAKPGVYTIMVNNTEAVVPVSGDDNPESKFGALNIAGFDARHDVSSTHEQTTAEAVKATPEHKDLLKQFPAPKPEVEQPKPEKNQGETTLPPVSKVAPETPDTRAMLAKYNAAGGSLATDGESHF